MLNRLDNIASATTGGTVYAQYTYLRAGTIARVDHPGVNNGTANALKLDYDPDGDGSFSAWDGFGRVTGQKWVDNAGTPNVLDGYAYGYDDNGNRS